MHDKISKEKIATTYLEKSFYDSSEETSLGDIASILGIKKASLYNHIKSRDEMISYTTSYAKECLDDIVIIPNDIASVVKKYSSETVFKGIINHYIKIFEKDPLQEVYTFLESRKYFDTEALKIITNHKNRLLGEFEKVMESLLEEKKMCCKKEQIPFASSILGHAVLDMLNFHMLERKKKMLSSRGKKTDDIFIGSSTENSIDKIDEVIEQFLKLLK